MDDSCLGNNIKIYVIEKKDLVKKAYMNSILCILLLMEG